MKGKSTFLTTGTDEHGQKVQKEAEKKHMEVKNYCDSIASVFQSELSHYDLQLGRFIRTTDPDHVDVPFLFPSLDPSWCTKSGTNCSATEISTKPATAATTAARTRRS